MNRPPLRRSFVLFAALVAIVLLSLSAMGIALVADVQSEGVAAGSRRVQSRALAWSGVQCVMAELARQRPRLLEAQPPQISTSWTMYEHGDGRGDRGLARLVDRSGQTLVAEAGRLDVNAATRDQLITVGLDAVQADRAVVGRAAGPYASPAEVGPLIKPPSEGEAADGAGDDDPQSRLTAFAFEPNVQVGIGPGAATLTGRPRIDISAVWSDQLGAALTERLGGEQAGPLIEQLRTKGPMKSYADLARWLASRGPQTPPADWAAYFDATTTTDSPVVTGRIDINTAPAEVLAAIPGLDRESADRIVLRRRAMEPTVRRSITWPLMEQLVTPEQFAKMADLVTTRSMVWRVVIEAGVASGKVDPNGSDPLADRVCYEAVVDLVDPVPRLAYLRNITELEFAGSADLAALAAQPEPKETNLVTRVESAPAASTAEPPPEKPRPADKPPRRSPSPKKASDSSAKPALKPTSARIGRWTAGATESENDAATQDRDQP